MEHITSNPSFIQPEARRNDILQRLQREPLLDLSISRTTFDWGIPLPDDPKHVMCASALCVHSAARALTLPLAGTSGLTR